MLLESGLTDEEVKQLDDINDYIRKGLEKGKDRLL